VAAKRKEKDNDSVPFAGRAPRPFRRDIPGALVRFGPPAISAAWKDAWCGDDRPAGPPYGEFFPRPPRGLNRGGDPNPWRTSVGGSVTGAEARGFGRSTANRLGHATFHPCPSPRATVPILEQGRRRMREEGAGCRTTSSSINRPFPNTRRRTKTKRCIGPDAVGIRGRNPC